MKLNKLFLIVLWIIILISGPFTVLKSVKTVRFSQDSVYLVSVLQRIIGLLVFSMLSVQIILGAFMKKWIKKLGPRILRFHMIQGVVIYSLVALHIFLFFAFIFKTRGTIDPFYVFTDFCLLCKPKIELYYTFGRIAFWLLSLAVAAAVLRGESWWRKNWKYFHRLNYAVFFLVALHTFFLSVDIKVFPFSCIFWFLFIVVIFSKVSTYSIFLKRNIYK
jgi:predicted ferric reductase